MPEPDPFVKALRQWTELFMHQSMRDFLRQTKECGLSMSQIGALFKVYHHGNTPISDISDEIGVTTAAASQMLEKLVQQGLILRSEDHADRRVKQIALTGKGRQIVNECIRARQSWIEDLARKLSPAEQEQVSAALDLLISKTQGLNQPAEHQI